MFENWVVNINMINLMYHEDDSEKFLEEGRDQKKV